MLLVTKVIEEEMGPLKSAALVEKIHEGVKAKYGYSNIEEDCKSINEEISHETSLKREDFQASLAEMEKRLEEIEVKIVESKKKFEFNMAKVVEVAAVKAMAIDPETKKLNSIQLLDSLAAAMKKSAKVKVELEKHIEAFSKERRERFASESKGGVKSNTA